MKSKKHKKRRQAKRARTSADKASDPKGKGRSRYARKSEYCKRHGVFGFQVPEPKPWK